MLLAIDIGNTNIVLGVFEGAALGRSWRLATARERTADELGLMVSDLLERGRILPSTIDGVVLASVVPQLTGPMIDMAKRYLGLAPLNVEAGVDLGMPNLYAHPSEVGADRLVNGIAAYEAYGRRRSVPLIVVSTSARPRRSTPSRRRASTSAASSARASRSRPMRCSSGPRGCRASTCASRPA